MRILYFAQDLTDAAVARRVRMLIAGGAEIKLLGFRRTPNAILAVEGVPAVDLGQTVDGRLARRALMVLRRSLQAGQWRDMVLWADLLLARNLDMCTIADAARMRVGSQATLVYECLDLHSALLRKSLPSKLLRQWERRILRRSAALIVSSPGFLDHHFNNLDALLPSVIMAENKRVMLGVIRRPPPTIPTTLQVKPWRIGWFGNIRCKASFQILLDLARRCPTLIDVDIRGKPTRELQTLIDQLLPIENMRFGGAYAQTDLATLYQAVHLTWGIDYFERGLNSDWLLPNRLYEGSFYNSPLIVQDGTQTATWLKTRQTGIVMYDPARELEPFLTDLTMLDYSKLQHDAANIPTADLVWTAEECRRVVGKLAPWAVGVTPNAKLM